MNYLFLLIPCTHHPLTLREILSHCNARRKRSWRFFLSNLFFNFFFFLAVSKFFLCKVQQQIYIILTTTYSAFFLSLSLFSADAMGLAKWTEKYVEIRILIYNKKWYQFYYRYRNKCVFFLVCSYSQLFISFLLLDFIKKTKLTYSCFCSVLLIYK